MVGWGLRRSKRSSKNIQEALISTNKYQQALLTKALALKWFFKFWSSTRETSINSPNSSLLLQYSYYNHKSTLIPSQTSFYLYWLINLSLSHKIHRTYNIEPRPRFLRLRKDSETSESGGSCRLAGCRSWQLCSANLSLIFFLLL